MEVEIDINEVSFREEASNSFKIVADNKLNWLLLCGPVAFLGSYYEVLGEASCFCLSGIALIPCAERYVLEEKADLINSLIFSL